MGHHEIWYTEHTGFEFAHDLQIHSVASSYHEGDIRALILRILDHIGEFAGGHAFAALIEEDDDSFNFLQILHDEERLLDLDILRIGVRDGLQMFHSDEFLCTFEVFIHGSGEVLVPIRNGKNCDHDASIKKFFDKTTQLYTICPHATIAQLVEHRFCKPAVISSSLIGGSRLDLEQMRFKFFFYGSVPERSNGEDCKSFVYDFGGSNPSRPTMKKSKNSTKVGFFYFAWGIFRYYYLPESLFWRDSRALFLAYWAMTSISLVRIENT